MKIITILLLLICFLNGHSQDLKNWQIGFNLNPFIFSRINPNFSYEKDKQNLPNGFGYGLTIEKNWNEKWGLKTGFENTKQNEKYFVDEMSADNTKIKSSFQYYKFPITVQYYYPLKEKLYLTLNQGIQFSILKYFKTVQTGNYQIHTYTSNYGESIFYEHPEDNQLIYGDFEEVMHKKHLFGIIGSFGLKGFLTHNISYTTNLRYEYDFTPSDLIQYYTTTPEKTHNFRLCFELGLQYHFSFAGCSYCSK